ncbi:MAG: hypothetical protein FJX72_00905 [Armatimonadetes bacterium]|nr:hypothetical protein [Armatimonadota bacterium]
MTSGRAGPVVCIGEVLSDVFGDTRPLGGAPLNLACHLRAFGVAAASRCASATMRSDAKS